MAVKKILQMTLTGGSSLDEALLRLPAKAVTCVDDNVLKIIKDLKDTINAYPFCVGLSAPQIGENYAISIIKTNMDEPENFLILINPVIISTSGQMDSKRESCMSVWGMTAEVKRRKKVEIEYRDLNFNVIQSKHTGFEARTILHEIDHLNGVLYVDRLNDGVEMMHADFFDEYDLQQ